jgi:hypothetical protein
MHYTRLARHRKKTEVASLGRICAMAASRRQERPVAGNIDAEAIKIVDIVIR